MGSIGIGIPGLYDPATGQWSPTGGLLTPRELVEMSTSGKMQ